MSKPKFTLSEATEADLPDIIALQFRTFAFLTIDKILVGPDTPSNRAHAITRHRTHMHTNTGMKTIKVTTDTHPQPVGFCIFYVPNPHAQTPEDKIPSPLKKPTSWIQTPHIEDPERRRLAENLINSANKQVHNFVRDRPCGYMRYMAVDPAYRRQGIGRLLMEWGCRFYDTHGADCYLQATEAGKRLYELYGFEQIGVVELDDESGVVTRLPAMWRTARPVQI